MMEQEEIPPEIPEESHKKGRSRKKQLLNSIQNQMNFYFSDANLSKDRFISQLLKESEYVDLSVFLSFNKIRKLTSSIDVIAKALKKSDFLELDETETKVKRKTPIKVKDCVDESTIYIQTIKPDTTHEWLAKVFSEFGKVDYVSIPKFSHNKINKGFAFIEYENEECAKRALEYFASINCLISTQINAEELCSNKVENHEAKAGLEEDDNPNELKRKIECDVEEESQQPSKRQKLVSESEELEEDQEENETDEKKKKKRSSKKKMQIKELGLQILSKNDWRKLRNRYWDMQRKKMNQLKQHLKKRFQNEAKQKSIENPPKADDTSAEVVKSDKDEKPFTSGVIVKLKTKDTNLEAKKIKNDLKSSNPDIQYVEIPVTLNSDIVFIRFGSAENAKAFCKDSSKGEASVLEGDEEKNYWNKINSSRSARLNKETKKQRGRDKLLKKAERELGKHIRFDD